MKQYVTNVYLPKLAILMLRLGKWMILFRNKFVPPKNIGKPPQYNFSV